MAEDRAGGPIVDEQRFRRLVDAVVDYAIYMLDPTGVVVSWNTGAQRFKGYTEQEILGQHFSRFYTDEDRATDLPRRALEIAASQGRFENEGWRVRNDGTRFWANVVIDPIRNPDGDLLGFAKVTRDLTARKIADDALRLSEERFRLLVQGVTDYAIYMLDPDGRVTNWNAGAERIKGYTADEIVGQHFSRFYTETDRAAGVPAKALATAIATGKYENEALRVRKDGTEFWAHVVIDPIYNDGALAGFAKITRDVTERRRAEEALAEARAKLLQSQKMEAVGQLTGGIAHDFNNLLTAVLGSLELLGKRLPDDPKLRRLLDNAVQGAQRGASLTQRMLAFARRQDLKVEAVDVSDLVRGMSDLLQRSIGSRVRIETRFPLGLAPARGDPNQLELAVLNLVLNARDAMPAGGAIVLSARQETVAPDNRDGLAPGDYVCVSVSDTGEGMDEATLARATEPFFTTKGVGRGTGLGLSMVHGVAEQSGGRLILTSREGEGTTAEIWLRPADVAAIGGAALPAEVGTPSRGQPVTVLVVDDDPLVLMNTAAMLDDLGNEVIEASSGLQALRILRGDKRVDLVITDQVMPGMTGLELIAAVQAEWPGVPLVLATGYAELPPGTDPNLAKLAKPFRQDALARTVAQHARLAEEDGTVIPFRQRT
jgi:PAS domain S-box-containing protein